MMSKERKEETSEFRRMFCFKVEEYKRNSLARALILRHAIVKTFLLIWTSGHRETLRSFFARAAYLSKCVLILNNLITKQPESWCTSNPLRDPRSAPIFPITFNTDLHVIIRSNYESRLLLLFHISYEYTDIYFCHFFANFCTSEKEFLIKINSRKCINIYNQWKMMRRHGFLNTLLKQMILS